MIYYHPHGLGDLIMAMPYIEQAQERDPSFVISVRPGVYNSGFFDHYRFKNRVLGTCPVIWDTWQIVFKYDVATNILERRDSIFVPKKGENRRKQLADFFGCDYDPGGRIYLPRHDPFIFPRFAHRRSAARLRSAPPWRIPGPIMPDHIPINLAFACLKNAARVEIANSVYLHACSAIEKDIDVLYSPWYFDDTPYLPENIKIHKIVKGTVLDVLWAGVMG